MTGTSVARALVCAASGSIRRAGPPSTSAAATITVHACFMATPDRYGSGERPGVPIDRRRRQRGRQRAAIARPTCRLLDVVEDRERVSAQDLLLLGSGNRE